MSVHSLKFWSAGYEKKDVLLLLHLRRELSISCVFCIGKDLLSVSIILSIQEEDLFPQRIKCSIIRKYKKVSTGINLDSSLPEKFLVELLFIYLHGPLAFLDTRNSLLRTQWASFWQKYVYGLEDAVDQNCPLWLPLSSQSLSTLPHPTTSQVKGQKRTDWPNLTADLFILR